LKDGGGETKKKKAREEMTKGSDRELNPGPLAYNLGCDPKRESCH
jgi:hypothetical protein